jgi:hypothetical protein
MLNLKLTLPSLGATLFLFRQEGAQLQTDPAGAFLFSHAVVGQRAINKQNLLTLAERNFFK